MQRCTLSRFKVLLFFTLFFLLFSTQSTLGDQHSGQKTIAGSPLQPKVAARLEPGLLPTYFKNYFERNVKMLPRKGGTVGEPVLELNHQFGRGKVFGSESNRGVGIRFKGALHFPNPGTYALQTLSNDGVIIYLNDKVVLSDPTQHSDQLSDESVLKVPAAGWYPIRIDYFQRKGTAALKLFWKTPESSEMVVVPARAYGHLPSD